MTTNELSPEVEPLAYVGEMTIYCAADNYQRLKDHLEKRQPVHLDLSAVTEIDSSGIQLLMYAQAEADANALDFSITALSDTVDDALNLLHLKRSFSIPQADSPEIRA